MEKIIDGILKKYMEEGYFPGVVCKVVQGDDCIYERAMGYAAVEPELRGTDMHTVFDIASLTKIITTTMVLMLATEGRLELECNVLQLIPETGGYDALQERLESVSLKDLLTHRSGLIDWYPFYSEAAGFFHVMDKLARITPRVEGVLYSDLNYMLLGKIVENITGKTLQDALNNLVVESLDIDYMRYCPENSLNVAATEFGNRIEKKMCGDRNISFDNWRDETRPICGEVNDGNTFYFLKGISGHAGIFSGIEGLIKVAQLYLKGGEWEGKELIDRGLAGEAMKEQHPGRGLGWQISPIFPGGCGHTGFTGTSIWLYPAKQTAVVTLTNRLHTELPQNLNAFRKELHETILKNLK